MFVFLYVFRLKGADTTTINYFCVRVCFVVCINKSRGIHVDTSGSVCQDIGTFWKNLTGSPISIPNRIKTVIQLYRTVSDKTYFKKF